MIQLLDNRKLDTFYTYYLLLQAWKSGSHNTWKIIDVRTRKNISGTPPGFLTLLDPGSDFRVSFKILLTPAPTSRFGTFGLRV